MKPPNPQLAAMDWWIVRRPLVTRPAVDFLKTTGNLNQEDAVNKSKWLLVSFCLSLIYTIGGTSVVRADDWNRATKLTFTEPVEVPGHVLLAGTYWFTLADSEADRNIVQVWNEDRTQLIATVLAVPDYRLKPAGKTIIHFEERPVDAPEAIHSWFYPGANYGEEFVYPKARASQLAKQVSRPVLSMPDAQPAPAQMKLIPVRAVAPSGEEVEISEIVESQPVATPQEAPAALPQTGSSLPLLWLIGLLALGTAIIVRVAARAIS